MLELSNQDWFSSEESRKYAEEILGETDQIREESITELREWLLSEPKIGARTDDASLLTFLRGKKFNIVTAKEKIVNFYAMRTKRPEWFHNRDPSLPVMRELLELGVFLPLKRFHDNRLVCIVRAGAHNPKKYKQDEMLKISKMILDVAIKENFENASVFGISCVVDMSDVSAGHAMQLTPQVIKKLVYAWQNYTCRPKAMEFVKAPYYINVILNIFKSFMSDKLKQRVRVHFGGIENLHKVIDKSILPIEYGGSGESLQELVQYWKQRLDENKEWLKEDEKYKSDLSK